ncbi:nuclease-related domain-containing protein [Virgibacillus sp. 179-BFC.A HS]|uniref:Nuclease-related domain-containing protein n=1 Tax=Tigheibacillus jepli TaxID=3035914 RepID=A0ABU5CED4_9BACI|nr:nuclease-related domain-containing protein [Virgibacillus sp. 179-BFC.A HS]MDY0404641.1 nuclease-related domain-containing protein [Virgibacillus sp. 179-BFC.A HS]
MNIIKKREYPLNLEKLQTMRNRLSALNSKTHEIEEEMRLVLAGFRGEQSIDYFLHFVTDDCLLYFHNLRIPWKNGLYFQIDTLILCPYFIAILEVKNISGKLFFDQLAEQLIRTIDGREEGFSYPVTQVNRQVYQLRMLLQQIGLPHIPIVPFVVVSNSSTIITTNPDKNDLFGQVTHASNLPDKLNKLASQFTRPRFTKEQLNQLSTYFLQNHQPLNSKYLEKFSLAPTEFLPGVVCEQCCRPTMIRTNGFWKCTQCRSKNRYAHIQALIDYYFLFGPAITNSQFRTFLCIRSTSLTSKLLGELNLSFTGTFKNRRYNLELNHLKQTLHDWKENENRA